MNPAKTPITLLALASLALAFSTLIPRTSAKLDLVGTAVPVDGDTLDMRGVRIRLFGIDAPENSQLCWDAQGKTWFCGIGAANKLAQLVSGQTLQCSKKDTDQYGRTVAICFAGGIDVNAEMVRQGFAISYRRYSTRYEADEMAARLAKRGLWAGRFENPETYRNARR